MARITSYEQIEAFDGDDALSTAEKTLLEKCQHGAFAAVGDGTRPATPSDENRVRAVLLRYLILGGCDACQVDTKGVQLVGAFVIGALNLDFGRAHGQTLLMNCHFNRPISALQTRFEALVLSGSQCPALNAQGVQVTGVVFLQEGFSAKGAVSLSGAAIGGQLNCANGSFDNAEGKALNAQGVQVKGHVFLQEGFSAKGEVSLLGAKIGGQLDCGNGSFDNAEGDALNAQGVQVTGDVFLQKGFSAKGKVSLSGAEIGGQLSCVNGSFDNADSDALMAQEVQVTGAVFLREGFSAKGKVSLAGAEIGGQLSCVNGSFDNAEGHALNTQGVQVTGDVFLQGGFSAKGEVSLSGAKIGGQLDCDNGSFDNAEGNALNAQGVQVKGNVFLRNGFFAKGEVSLSGAEIGGQLSCINGSFENAGGDALMAEGAKVTGAVFLRNGFSAEGEVRLSGATIGGQLSCTDGSFDNAEGKALNAQKMTCTQFFWREVAYYSGGLDLNGAKIEDLADDMESWDKVDALTMNGIRIGTLHGPTDVAARLTWLRKGARSQGEFAPQPFEEFARVLREMGHESDSRQVLIDKHRQHGKAMRRQWRSRRQLGRLIARFSKTRNQENAEQIDAYRKSRPEIGKTYATSMINRFMRIHRDYAKPEGTEPPSEWQMQQAAAGFRERIFWRNAGIRARLCRMQLLDKSLRWLVGYGHAPYRSLYSLAGLFLIAVVVFHYAYENGDFAPNSAVILTSEEWQAIADLPNCEVDQAMYAVGEQQCTVNPAAEWSNRKAEKQGRDYETFNRYAYAADVVIPIIYLGQEAAWAPSTNRGAWGWHAWWARWVLTVLGWIVTAVGVAAIGRHIQQK